jgi:hypothetical protein
MLNRLFLDHPQKEGMTYLQHLKRAWTFSWQMGRGTVALFIHGLCPSMCEYTGTQIIRELHTKIQNHEDCN